MTPGVTPQTNATQKPSENHPTVPSVGNVGIQDLAPEVKLRIFSFLRPQNVPAASLVCKDWNVLLNEATLWKFFLNRDYDSKGLEKGKTPKEAYRENCKFFVNITNGVYATKRIQAPSDTNRSTRHLALAKDGRTLASVSYLGAIQVYDLETLVCKKDLHCDQIVRDQAHDVVSAALTKRGELILGFQRGNIHILDLEKTTLKKILCCEEKSSFILTEDEKKLILIPRQGIIKTYNLENGDRKTVSEEDDSLICSRLLSKDEKKLIIGYESGATKIWHLESGTCEATVQSIDKGYPTSLALRENGDLIIGSSKDKIHIWDLKEGVCKKTLDAQTTKNLNFLQLPTNNKLISLSSNGPLQIWDLETYACLHTIGNPNPLSSFERLAAVFSVKGALVIGSPEKIAIVDFAVSDEDDSERSES